MKKSLFLLSHLFLLSLTLFSQNLRIDSLQSIINHHKFTSASEEQLSAIDNIFEEYLYQDNEEKSTHFANLLIEKAQSIDHQFFFWQGNINKAWTCFYANKEEGLALIKATLEAAQKVDNKLIEGQCYYYIGKYNSEYNGDKTDYSYFQKALQSYESVKTTKVIDPLIDLWNRKVDKEGFSEALKEINNALTRAKIANNTVAEMKALTTKLFYEYQVSNYREARKNAFEIEALAKKHNYLNKDLVSNYTITSILHNTKNQPQLALKYIELAYEISLKTTNVRAKISAAIKLAAFYVKNIPEKHDEAKKLLDQSIALSIKHHYPRKHILALSAYGDLYKKRKEPEKAMEKYLNCIAISDTVKLAYYSTLDLAIKIKVIRLGGQIPNNIDSSSIIPNNIISKRLYCLLQKEIAVKEENFKEAYGWAEKEKKYTKQILTNKQNINFQELHLENQLFAEQTENSKTKNLLSISTIVNLLSFSTILVFLLLLWSTISQNKAKKIHLQEMSDSANQIQLLNNKLTNKNLALKEKNKVRDQEIFDFVAYKAAHDKELNSIKDKFEYLSKQQNLKPLELKLIQSKLENLQSDEDENWITFKQKIEDTYPNFFSKLTLQHPILTEKDKVQCGYLLIGMSIKATAEVTHVSQATVKSSRYRIKKKIGLTKDENLKEYLLTNVNESSF